LTLAKGQAHGNHVFTATPHRTSATAFDSEAVTTGIEQMYRLAISLTIATRHLAMQHGMGIVTIVDGQGLYLALFKIVLAAPKATCIGTLLNILEFYEIHG
jgi:hypothetical protein